MIATKSVCALHLYVNRRDPLLAGRAKDARGGCSGFKESCQEEDACGENRKVGQANSRRYEIESILSWGFVRFSRIRQNSFSFWRNLSDHTAIKSSVEIGNLWGTDKLGAPVRQWRCPRQESIGSASPPEKSATYMQPRSSIDTLRPINNLISCQNLLKDQLRPLPVGERVGARGAQIL